MDMTDDPNLEKQLADLGADHEPAEDWQVRVWKQIKARFPTGTQVRIIRGEYAGRSGTATDNVDKLQALDALIQRNTHLGAKIRKQHEIPVDPPNRPWWEVLCVQVDVLEMRESPLAVLAKARRAHRMLIRTAHPDVGGDADHASAINVAFAEAERELEAAEARRVKDAE
jgi:hypothetical protein